VNPEAVELAKLSLWIESLARGKPFTFLNAHLRCGNSLIGAWFFGRGVGNRESGVGGEVEVRLGRKGVLKLHRLEFVPEEVFRKDEADLKRENRATLEALLEVAPGQLGLFGTLDFRKFLGKLIELRGEIDRRATATPDDYRDKESRLRHLAESPEYQLLKAIGDAWCTLWFWPRDVRKPTTLEYRAYLKTLMENFLDSPLPTAQSLLPKPPQFISEERFWEIFFTVRKVAQKHRFFHWELEFPEVFLTEDSGFHAILGNPPWEKIQVEDKQFFAGRREDIVSARTAAQRAKLIEALREEDPLLYEEYQKTLYDTKCFSSFLRYSSQYPLTAQGHINYYAVFAERARTLMGRRDGRVGLIIPSGIATDNTTKEFFQSISESGELAFLYDFENREGLFNIHRSYKFCLFGLSGKGGERAELAFFLTRPEELREEDRRFSLSPEDFRLLNPNTRTCPIFRRRSDADLTLKIYRHCPVLVDETRKDGNPWDIRFKQGLFNMSSDSHLFRTREELEAEGYKLKGNIFVKAEEDVYLPLYEAKMITQFDHRHGDYKDLSERPFSRPLPSISTKELHNPNFVITPWYWVHLDNIDKNITEWPRLWFLGFRRITRAIDLYSCWFCFLPFVATTDTIPIIISKQTSILIALLCNNFNSLVVNYSARQKISGIHLDFFVVKQLPIFPPDFYSINHLLFAIPRILELTYTAWDMKPFADDIWAEADETLRSAIREQWEENAHETGGHKNATPPDWLEIIYSLKPNNPNKNVCPLPPFKWDEERRAQIRAELDAIFAHLYGLTRDEFAYILDTFPIVRRKDEERFGEYRTKRLCLEQYDRFDGQIPHPKPLDEKPITKVISLKEAQERKREKLTVTYEELQEKLSPEYSLPKAAEPKSEYISSEDLERIKEKIFDLLIESNRALSVEEIANELNLSLAICKKALIELTNMKVVKENRGKFELYD